MKWSRTVRRTPIGLIEHLLAFMIFLIVLRTHSLHIEMVTYCTSFFTVFSLHVWRRACNPARGTTLIHNRGRKYRNFHVFMTFLLVLPTPRLKIEMVTYCTSCTNNKRAKLRVSILVLKYATTFINLLSKGTRVRWSAELF